MGLRLQAPILEDAPVACVEQAERVGQHFATLSNSSLAASVVSRVR